MREPLKKAFDAAGIPYGRRVGKVFHGTRRTAVTNLVESGVPRSVAKTISGHSSDEMFERYAIHESDAQRAAQRRAAAFVAKQPKKPKVVPIATRKKKGAA